MVVVLCMVSATELFSDEGMERSLGECLWM